jgi:AcrR family transcriptional regulator
MNSSTRDRLLEAATQLFSEHGYRGASVRDICDLARANPGAVSYHFGGKRPLYRTVLRQAADRLAQVNAPAPDPSGPVVAPDRRAVLARILRRLHDHPRAVRLLLRDLAEGGEVALQSLQPTLRSALDALATETGSGDGGRAPKSVRALFLALACPVITIGAAGSLLERALDLAPGEATELALEAAVLLLDHAPLSDSR